MTWKSRPYLTLLLICLTIFQGTLVKLDRIIGFKTSWPFLNRLILQMHYLTLVITRKIITWLTRLSNTLSKFCRKRPLNLLKKSTFLSTYKVKDCLKVWWVGQPSHSCWSRTEESTLTILMFPAILAVSFSWVWTANWISLSRANWQSIRINGELSADKYSKNST